MRIHQFGKKKRAGLARVGWIDVRMGEGVKWVRWYRVRPGKDGQVGSGGKYVLSYLRFVLPH